MKAARIAVTLLGFFALGWVAAFFLWLAYVLGWARRSER